MFLLLHTKVAFLTSLTSHLHMCRAGHLMDTESPSRLKLLSKNKQVNKETCLGVSSDRIENKHKGHRVSGIAHLSPISLSNTATGSESGRGGADDCFISWNFQISLTVCVTGWRSSPGTRRARAASDLSGARTQDKLHA